jgi:hypothetical protein
MGMVVKVLFEVVFQNFPGVAEETAKADVQNIHSPDCLSESQMSPSRSPYFMSVSHNCQPGDLQTSWA